MTRLSSKTDDLAGMVCWTDVYAVIAELGLPEAWRENSYYVQREKTPPEERLQRQLWEFNVSWGTDVGLDDYLAAVVAHADDVGARAAAGARHLYDERTRRERAERERDELRRLLAEAGLA